MDFDQFLKDSWGRHGDEPEQVFDALPVGRALAQNAAHLVAWAGLASHVAGEHLGRWADGLRLLDDVVDDPYLLESSNGHRSVQRSRAALLLASGDAAAADAVLAEHSDPAWPVASSRVRVLAIAASALAAQGQVARGRARFEEAVEVIGYGPRKDDPAAKSLAIAGNNLAMDLEELPSRTSEQDALMVLAARTSRTWWKVAGNETNVLLADVRVASALLAAGDAEAALPFARDAARDSGREGVLAGFRIQAMLVLGRTSLATGDVEAATEALTAADVAFTELPEAYHAFYEPQIEALRVAALA